MGDKALIHVGPEVMAGGRIEQAVNCVRDSAKAVVGLAGVIVDGAKLISDSETRQVRIPFTHNLIDQ